jgi:hypothetical protein
MHPTPLWRGVYMNEELGNYYELFHEWPEELPVENERYRAKLLFKSVNCSEVQVFRHGVKLFVNKKCFIFPIINGLMDEPEIIDLGTPLPIELL